MTGLVPFNKRNTSIFRNGQIDFNNMIDDFFNDFWPVRSLASDTFKIDVQENDEGYMIEAELPGVKKDEISLEINDGQLNISIKREESVDEQKKNYIHKERRYTSMSRSIYLKDIKQDDIKAKLENGLLSISIPKEARKTNSVAIEVE